jgi:hypothetical protein
LDRERRSRRSSLRSPQELHPKNSLAQTKLDSAFQDCRGGVPHMRRRGIDDVERSFWRIGAVKMKRAYAAHESATVERGEAREPLLRSARSTGSRRGAARAPA